MSFFTKFLGIVNWKTTLSGALAMLGTLATLVPALAPWRDLIMTFIAAMGSVGLMTAKDGNVTGGTVPATVEAEGRSVGAASIIGLCGQFDEPRRSSRPGSSGTNSIRCGY